MITADDPLRTEVDATVDAALHHLHERAARHGRHAGALAGAAVSAAMGGKRARPALTVASFDAFAGPDAARPDALWDIAAAVELLHAAFVVHDDLIDHDLERRGTPTVSARFRAEARQRGCSEGDAAAWGDAAAVLAGDLLLFEATRLVAAADIPAQQRTAILGLFDDAVLASAGGEMADVEHALVPDWPDTGALLTAAHDKTAVYSFRAPLCAGATLGGAEPAHVAAFSAAAGDLGLAFQLVDDLIGSFGTRKQAGRAPGADLREAKRTPLLGLARQSANWGDVQTAISVAATGPIAIKRAQKALEDSGARERLTVVISDTLRSARSRTAEPALPAEAVMLLARLADAVEDRIP